MVSLMLIGSDGQQLQQCRGLIKEHRGPLVGAGNSSEESWKGTEGSKGIVRSFKRNGKPSH